MFFFPDLEGRIVIFLTLYPFLKLTASLPLKMDGFCILSPFLGFLRLFSGANWPLVSGRVPKIPPTKIVKRNRLKPARPPAPNHCTGTLDAEKL